MSHSPGGKDCAESIMPNDGDRRGLAPRVFSTLPGVNRRFRPPSPL
jgi:hypothetical protein